MKTLICLLCVLFLLPMSADLAVADDNKVVNTAELALLQRGRLNIIKSSFQTLLTQSEAALAKLRAVEDTNDYRHCKSANDEVCKRVYVEIQKAVENTVNYAAVSKKLNANVSEIDHMVRGYLEDSESTKRLRFWNDSQRELILATDKFARETSATMKTSDVLREVYCRDNEQKKCVVFSVYALKKAREIEVWAYKRLVELLEGTLEHW